MTTNGPRKVDETHFPAKGSIPDRLRFLLQYAVLAPSSHNTQPWKFRVDGNRIDIFLDEARWLKICDDEQRELHISAGCCLENLLVAADHFGLRRQVEYLPDSSNSMHAVKAEFVDTAATGHDSRLFPMLSVRHTNHGEYDGRPIPEDVLEQLSGCCIEPNIHVQLTSDNLIKQKVDALVDYRNQIASRSSAVWLLIICAEIIHGILRAVLLVPIVRDFRSNQIGVFTGAAIIILIACITIRWIGAKRPSELLMVGAIWLMLTVAFELLFGRFVMGLTWERITADYNVLNGGLMPLGLLILLLSPMIAIKLRGKRMSLHSV